MFGIRFLPVRFGSGLDVNVTQMGIGGSKEIVKASSNRVKLNNNFLASFEVSRNRRFIHKNIWKTDFNGIVEHALSISRNPYQSILPKLLSSGEFGLISNVCWNELSIDDKVISLHNKAHFIYATSDIGFRINKADMAHVKTFERDVNAIFEKALKNGKLNSGQIPEFDFSKLVEDCSEYIGSSDKKKIKGFVENSPLMDLLKCLQENSYKHNLLNVIDVHFMTAFNQLEVSILLNSIFGEVVCLPLTESIINETSKVNGAIFKMFGISGSRLSTPYQIADHILRFVTVGRDNFVSNVLVDQKNLKGFEFQTSPIEIFDIYAPQFESFFKPVPSSAIKFNQLDSMSHFDIFNPKCWKCRVVYEDEVLELYQVIDRINSERAKMSQDVEKLIDNIIIPSFKTTNISEFIFVGSNTGTCMKANIDFEKSELQKCKLVRSQDSFFISINELDLINNQVVELREKMFEPGVTETRKLEISGWITYLEQSKVWVERLHSKGLSLSRGFAAYTVIKK